METQNRCSLLKSQCNREQYNTGTSAQVGIQVPVFINWIILAKSINLAIWQVYMVEKMYSYNQVISLRISHLAHAQSFTKMHEMWDAFPNLLDRLSPAFKQPVHKTSCHFLNHAISSDFHTFLCVIFYLEKPFPISHLEQFLFFNLSNLTPPP